MVYDTEDRAILLLPALRKKKRKLIFEVKKKTRQLRSCKSLRTYKSILKKEEKIYKKLKSKKYLNQQNVY